MPGSPMRATPESVEYALRQLNFDQVRVRVTPSGKLEGAREIQRLVGGEAWRIRAEVILLQAAREPGSISRKLVREAEQRLGRGPERRTTKREGPAAAPVTPTAASPELLELLGGLGAALQRVAGALERIERLLARGEAPFRETNGNERLYYGVQPEPSTPKPPPEGANGGGGGEPVAPPASGPVGLDTLPRPPRLFSEGGAGYADNMMPPLPGEEDL